jgi:ADP-ribosylglycohydrolase
VVTADAKITDAAPLCVAASVALASVLAGLREGGDPGAALAATRRQSRNRNAHEQLRTALAAADDPSLATLRSNGGVLDTLVVEDELCELAAAIDGIGSE